MEYNRELFTISIVKANIIAIIGIIPVLLIFGLPYFLLWGSKYNIDSVTEILHHSSPKSLLYGLLYAFIIIIIGAIIHELLHGITWSFFTKERWKSIHFGFIWQMLTPYCHCSEPLPLKHYIAGAVIPGIILGQIPAIISIIIGNIYLLAFGVFFTLAAFGDFIIIYKLRNLDSNTMILDHETEAGCWVYRNLTE